jgi:uncharacterized membrane-anchored protein
MLNHDWGLDRWTLHPPIRLRRLSTGYDESAIFLSALIVLVVIQISAKKFHPFLYWTVIVASTTAGTTMADFATRSLGVGYAGGSLMLFACLMGVLALWYWSEGSISVETVSTSRPVTTTRLRLILRSSRRTP